MSEKKLKPLHSWLIFGGSMVVVFLLGLLVSSLMERRAEVASIFNNRKNPMQGIVAQNPKFKSDFPREYETWKATEETDFRSTLAELLESADEKLYLGKKSGRNRVVV